MPNFTNEELIILARLVGHHCFGGHKLVDALYEKLLQLAPEAHHMPAFARFNRGGSEITAPAIDITKNFDPSNP